MKEKTTITDQDIKNVIKALNRRQPGIGDYEQMSWEEFVELMDTSKSVLIETTPKVKDSWKFIKSKKK